MSLNFDTTAVVNKYVLHVTGPDGHDQWSPVTQALVWATVHCGMNEITEANVWSFWQRLSLVQTATGPISAFPYAAWDLVMLTEQNVRDHIGLRTNANLKTQAVFLKDLWRWHCEALDIQRTRDAAAASALPVRYGLSSRPDGAAG